MTRGDISVPPVLLQCVLLDCLPALIVPTSSLSRRPGIHNNHSLRGHMLRIGTIDWTGALVQLLQLPAWKVGDRGFVPRSGIEVLKIQNVSSSPMAGEIMCA